MAEDQTSHDDDDHKGDESDAAPRADGDKPNKDGDDDGEDEPKKPNPLKNPKVLIIGAIVVVVLLIGGLLYWLHARQYVSTDDAFVDTHIVRLAPQVSGQVSTVLVDDNAFVHAGQPLIEVDACPAHLQGKVVSIQRGAGQAFALLPSENATGNYVKVVQRVPVKISFDSLPPDCPLGPGLSVQPRVKVR